MTSSLNPAQFSPRDQTLPGMPLPYADVVRPRQGPAPRRWSGIAPGQQVMGVHDLAEGYEADPHGFIHEPERGTAVAGPNGQVQFKRIAVADEQGNGHPARAFYGTVGGKFHKDPMVNMHWAKQPVRQVASDAIIHTAQHWEHETEAGEGNPFDAVLDGRKRINAIREDLDAGGQINRPAWLMKHNNRLYALDGHHRIVAAREAGHATFPARVWDRDAEAH